MMKDEKLRLPDWFIVGLKFRSPLFLREVTVLSIDVSRNNLEVEIYYAGSTYPTTETWDLDITLWAFQKFEYQLI